MVWGAEDHMVPVAHGRTYAKSLGGGASLKLIAGAGHAAHLEKPAEVLAALQPVLPTQLRLNNRTTP